MSHFRRIQTICIAIGASALGLLYSCNPIGPDGIFAKKSPLEQYGQKLTQAGLHQTAMGRLWFNAMEISRNQPLQVTIPFRETGYFPAENPKAIGLAFTARRGQKLNIVLEKRPVSGFSLYMDLWKTEDPGTAPKHIASADTSGVPLAVEIEQDASYLLTLQPELLRSGEYTLTITAGPSLGFPLNRNNRSQIQSFYGDDRDAGARKHEGLDIFSAFRTPAIAAANGTISNVTINNLGGKVVFLRPAQQNYTLYYAHLDSQSVYEGQLVRQGDTIGLLGNTGNAAGTSPHLHFGIYTSSVAIDPLPFIDPMVKPAAEITSSLTGINKSFRARKALTLPTGKSTAGVQPLSIPENTMMVAEAATGNQYRVLLPDGNKVYISSSQLSPVTVPLRKIRLPQSYPLYDRPDTSAARKIVLNTGEVGILGVFKDFYFVSANGNTGWIMNDKK